MSRKKRTKVKAEKKSLKEKTRDERRKQSRQKRRQRETWIIVEREVMTMVKESTEHMR